MPVLVDFQVICPVSQLVMTEHFEFRNPAWFIYYSSAFTRNCS